MTLCLVALHWAVGVTCCAEDPQPDDTAAVEVFEKSYALEEGEVLKYVPPPFSDARLTYYRVKDRGQADAIPRGPDAMYLRWEEGKLERWGMTFGTPTLPTILRMLASIYPQDLDGDEDLLKAPIPGDFVVRTGADTKDILAQLERAVEQALGHRVRIAYREVEREVVVVKGDYDFTPIDEQWQRIEIYGERLNENPRVGGGGSGDFDQFLRWVGMWIEMPVVSEVEAPPEGQLSWHYNDGNRPLTAEARKAAKDPILVLLNLSVQTNLQFTIEPRRIQVLFVEREEAVQRTPKE